MKNKKTVSTEEITVLTNKKSKWRLLGKQKSLILMSVPFVLYIILFRYIPLWGWTMAFQNYKPSKTFFQQTWVGFRWFKELFQSDEFLRSLRNTVGMSLISTALGYISAITIAVFLNEVRNVAAKRFVQTVSYLPHFISMVIVTGMIRELLSTNGPINAVLKWFGGDAVSFIALPQWFTTIFVASGVWQSL